MFGKKIEKKNMKNIFPDHRVLTSGEKIAVLKLKEKLVTKKGTKMLEKYQTEYITFEEDFSD